MDPTLASRDTGTQEHTRHFVANEEHDDEERNDQRAASHLSLAQIRALYGSDESDNPDLTPDVAIETLGLDGLVQEGAQDDDGDGGDRGEGGDRDHAGPDDESGDQDRTGDQGQGADDASSEPAGEPQPSTDGPGDDPALQNVDSGGDGNSPAPHIANAGANDNDGAVTPVSAGGDKNALLARWLKVNSGYHDLAFKLARHNLVSPTQTRGKVSAIVSKQWAKLGGPEKATPAHLSKFENLLKGYVGIIAFHARMARKSWAQVQLAYFGELRRLRGSPDLVERIAEDYLKSRYKKSAKRVMAVGLDDLVKEDFLQVDWTLRKQTHMRHGKVVGAREKRRLAKERAKLAKRRSRLKAQLKNKPGIGTYVWAFVGYDSWTEFAGDVALTVLTLGLGKAVKIVNGARKALTKYLRYRRLRKRVKRNLKRIARLRKQLQQQKRLKVVKGAYNRRRRLQKFRRRASRMARNDPRMVRDWLKLVQGLDFSKLVAGLTAKRGKIVSAVTTDFFAARGAGGAKGVAPAAVERIGKEAIGLYVETAMGYDKDKEEALFKAGVVGFKTAAGKRQIKQYFWRNFKRRVMTNLVYYSLLSVGNRKVRARFPNHVGVSTSFEMSQDLVMMLGPAKPLQLIIETARKTIQTKVKSALKNVRYY